MGGKHFIYPHRPKETSDVVQVLPRAEIRAKLPCFSDQTLSTPASCSRKARAVDL